MVIGVLLIALCACLQVVGFGLVVASAPPPARFRLVMVGVCLVVANVLTIDKLRRGVWL